MITRKGNSDVTMRYRYAVAYVAKARATGDRRHLRRAEKALFDARQALIQRASQAGSDLRLGLEAQQRLAAEAASGRISPELANEKSREILARVAALRSKATEINSLLNADVAAVASAAPDLELKDYAGRVRGTPKIDLWPTRRGFVLWLLIIILIVLTGMLYSGVIQLRAPVHMSVRAIQPGGPFTLIVRNDGTAPANLFVPGEGSDEAASGSYIVKTFVRGNAGEFRAAECLDCWTYLGATLNEPIRVSVAPRLTVEFGFRPARLRDWHIEGDAVRFILMGPNGETAGQQTLDY